MVVVSATLIMQGNPRSSKFAYSIEQPLEARYTSSAVAVPSTRVVIAVWWPVAEETLPQSRKEDIKCWTALLSRISKDVKTIGGACSIPAMQLASAADMAAKRNELAR